MLDSILIIGSVGRVGHDMMYMIAAITSKIRVVGADIDEEKGRMEVEESLHDAHDHKTSVSRIQSAIKNEGTR